MSSIASSSRLVLSLGLPFRAPITAAPGIKLVRAQIVAPGIKLVRRSIHSKAPASSMAAASSEASRSASLPTTRFLSSSSEPAPQAGFSPKEPNFLVPEVQAHDQAWTGTESDVGAVAGTGKFTKL